MPAEGVKLSGPRIRGKTVNGSFSGDTCTAGAEGATTRQRLESLRQKDRVMLSLHRIFACVKICKSKSYASFWNGQPQVCCISSQKGAFLLCGR